MKKYKITLLFINQLKKLTFVETDIRNPNGDILFWSTKYDLAYTEKTLLKLGAKLITTKQEAKCSDS